MTPANLLVYNNTLGIEEKSGRVSGLLGSIPAQPVEICDLIIRVGDECYVSRQRFLLLEEFLRPAVQLGRWTGINEKDTRFLLCKVGGVSDEVMGLFLAIRALVAGVPTKNDEHCRSFASLI